jgi:hypothetical protein
VLNEAAFAYLRGRAPAARLIARLAEAGEDRFADQVAWRGHLNRLGIVSPAKTGLAVIQDPVQIATEGLSGAASTRTASCARPWC